MKTLIASVMFLFLLVSVEPAFSHSGGTNSAGCHTNHRTGDYHCHNAKPRYSNQVAYCHVVGGEDRCGYALSTCNNLVQEFGGWCRREN